MWEWDLRHPVGVADRCASADGLQRRRKRRRLATITLALQCLTLGANACRSSVSSLSGEDKPPPSSASSSAAEAIDHRNGSNNRGQVSHHVGGAWQSVSASFLRGGVELYWVPRVDVLDDQSMEWLKDLGSEALGIAPDTGLPLWRFQSLIATKDEMVVPVNWPGDLRGLVEIRRAEQAPRVRSAMLVS